MSGMASDGFANAAIFRPSFSCGLNPNRPLKNPVRHLIGWRFTPGRLNNQAQHLVKVLRWETNTNN